MRAVAPLDSVVTLALYSLFNELSTMTRVSDRRVVFIRVVGELLFLYGFLGWMYGVLVQLIHPGWLPLGLSHVIPWIRVDTFAIMSFIVSAVGFLIWRFTRGLNT
jgi:hypothetical protein